MLKKIRWSLEFILLYLPYTLLRFAPWHLMRSTAWAAGFCMHLLPQVRTLARANIRAAMPELSEKEVRRICRASLDHLMWNLLEYVWLTGNEKRIRRYCAIDEFTTCTLKELVANGTRVIYVNPHMGSWEISGLMSPFYAGVKIAAIAKPLKNPYLNKLFNHGNREATGGVRIIFSKGAMRAAITALKEGWGIGTLNDQNTRVRDGGVFVNFFGLPVPGSTAPAMMKEYCNQKNIPCQIFFACSLREKSGKVIGRIYPLKKKFEEYSSHAEILQEFMDATEELIRRYPEQYLWFYKRFQHIPEDATPEQLKRYPAYARRPGKNFYQKLRQRNTGTAGNGETEA
jgi:KDO2-lipid IV(A) lauroyltransferase